MVATNHTNLTSSDDVELTNTTMLSSSSSSSPNHTNDAMIYTSSISTEQVMDNGNVPCSTEERRFVWFQKEEETKLRMDASSSKQYVYMGSTTNHAVPASSKLDAKDFKDKVRAGAGAKGRTGSTDFTRGKNAFVRPCTVGWKSQNQPLMKGGGPRTPRQKG